MLGGRPHWGTWWKIMKKIIFLFFITLLFISCTSTYKYDINNPSKEILEKNKEIAVSVSEDGSYGSDIYNGSGRTLSNTIRQQLKKYSSNVVILKNNETLKDFTDEEIKNYDYIVIPEILHWEDRATAWSGLPDKIEVSIEIYDSKRNLLKSAILSGKSASMTLGSTDPSELLEEPLSTFFKSVFEE